MTPSKEKVLIAVSTVYVELVFLDNLMLNFLCLLMAAVFTKSPKKILRLLAGAALGAVYACIVFSSRSFAASMIVKIAAGMLMCAAAFAGRGFWKNAAAFFITSFIIAGAAIALKESLIDNGSVFSATARAVIGGAASASVLIIIISRVRKKTLDREKLTEDLRLTFGEKSVCVKAYYDTGNTLCDPLSGHGVIFVDKETAKKLFDEAEIALIEGSGSKETDRLRILPCSTTAGQSIVFGLMIDSAQAFNKQTKAIVSIANGQMAHGAQAIVGNKIIDELKGGADDDKNVVTPVSSSDNDKAENRSRSKLHKRQRGSSSAALKAGGR